MLELNSRVIDRRFPSITSSSVLTLGWRRDEDGGMFLGGLALVLHGWMCPAQQNPVPFERLQQDAALRIPSAAAGNLGLSMAPPSPYTGVSSPPPSTTAPKVIDKAYLLLNGLHLGLALADVEATQHCIASHRCREGNPLMPSSQAGQISINAGLFAYAAGSSYWLKRHKAKGWWAPPAAGIAGHAVGVASGLRNW